MPSNARVAMSFRTAMLGRIGSIPSIRGDPHLSVLVSLVKKSCIRSSSSELILLVRSGFLRRRDLLELESAESSFEVRLWLGEGTGAGAVAVAETAAAGDVDGARSGGLSVLVVPATSGVVTSGVDGTFAEIKGNDLATHAAGGGTGCPPSNDAAAATAVIAEDDAGGLRLRVGL